MNHEQELMIQRLVDNELDEQQRAEFLKMAEAEPELWRHTAISFVEDRVWSAVVGQSVVGQEGRKANPASATNQTVAVTDRANGAGTEKIPVSRNHKPWWLRYGPQLLMTAASVLFVLTLALRFNPVEPDSGPGTNNLGTQTPDTSEQLVNKPYRLRMDDIDLPVYEDGNQYRNELEKIGDLDAALVKRFHSAGYRIEPDVRYIAGKLPDGRRVVMPVQSFKVVRIGQ